jgi:hypothetical protein
MDEKRVIFDKRISYEEAAELQRMVQGGHSYYGWIPTDLKIGDRHQDGVDVILKGYPRGRS